MHVQQQKAECSHNQQDKTQPTIDSAGTWTDPGLGLTEWPRLVGGTPPPCLPIPHHILGMSQFTSFNPHHSCKLYPVNSEAAGTVI